MADDPDYILDLSADERNDTDVSGPVGPGSTSGTAPGGRRWIGVHFECCGVYVRIYRNRAGTAYEGCCPRCQRRAHVRVGPGGTDSRIFRAQ